MSEQATPALSVVVAIVSDTIDRRADPRHLRECLEKLRGQSGAPPMEVIVPYYPPIIDVEPLTREFPDVRFIPISDLKTYSGQAGGREHHDELRAQGLAFARGETIALLEDHGHVCDGWARTAVAFRNTEYGGVGGAIDSGIDRPLNTAVYYCDFFRYQSPVVEGESFLASDANVAYRRDALESVREVWQLIFHETAVNNALRTKGWKLALSRHMAISQHRYHLRFGSALQERYIWGRSYAGTRTALTGAAKRWVLAALTPLLPLVILLRIARSATAKGHFNGQFVRALPLIAMLTAAWSLGELMGYITGRSDQRGTPAGDAISGRSHTAA